MQEQEQAISTLLTGELKIKGELSKVNALKEKVIIQYIKSFTDKYNYIDDRYIFLINLFQNLIRLLLRKYCNDFGQLSLTNVFRDQTINIYFEKTLDKSHAETLRRKISKIYFRIQRFKKNNKKTTTTEYVCKQLLASDQNNFSPRACTLLFNSSILFVALYSCDT